MLVNQTLGNVIDIPRERADEAVEVLALAFEHDPFMQYLLSGQSQQTAFHRQLCEIYHFLCVMCFDLEWPLLGYEVDAKIVGVACVEDPDDKPQPDSVKRGYDRLTSVIGPEATHRLEAYFKLTDQYRPKQPSHYLNSMCVRPEAQGRGYGRIMLDAVHALSEAHETSSGVALDTENAVNVPLYEHCGYGVIAKTKLEHLDVWYMFRPKRIQRKT